MSGASLLEYKFVVRWTVQDVINWLQENGFVDCSKIFRDAGIDGNKFVNLTENDLSRINCPQELRKEILYHISTIRNKPERDKFSMPFTNKAERDKFSRPSPAKQTPARPPAQPPVQALTPNRPPVALPPQGNKHPKQSDADDDDGWGSEEFDSDSESEEQFEIGGRVMKNEGGDSDYDSTDEKSSTARSQARSGQQPKSSAPPGARRVAAPPPTEDEVYEDPDAPKPTLFHGGPLPTIPSVSKTVSDFPPVPKSPVVPSRSRPKIPDVAEETYEDPDAPPAHSSLPRPPKPKTQACEGPNVQNHPKISAPPPASQIKTPHAAGKRPIPTPQEPEVYEDPNVQTSVPQKNNAQRTPQLPSRRPPPTPQEPEDYENTEEAVQKFQSGKKPPPIPPSVTGSSEIEDEYIEMVEKNKSKNQPSHKIDESDEDYLDPDPGLRVDPPARKPAQAQVLPKLETPKPSEAKLPPRKLPPPPTDSDSSQIVPTPAVPRVAQALPVTYSQSSGSGNEEEEELKTKPWYHGVSTRQEVEPKMMHLKTNGMYCVRHSSGKPNQPYTLVVFCENRIFNLPIRLRNDKKYALGGEKTDEVPFGSIVELVRFFRRNILILNGLKGQQTQLKMPLPK